MNKNLDVLFLGGLFPKEKEEEIILNSLENIQNAANNLQWEIVKGLDANLDTPIKIVNSLYVGSYPKRYKKLFINNFMFSHTLGAKDTNVGFINLPGVKHIHKFLTLKPHVKKWAIQNDNRKKIVIAYAMTLPFTKVIRYLKGIDDSIVTCLIVPDLPQYMNLANSKRSKLYKLLKNIEIKQMSNDLKYVDSYVLLTKYMREALKVNVPNVIVEGVATDSFNTLKSMKPEKGKKVILYSGGLMKKYGVIDLLNSFEKLRGKKYQLIICGSGEVENEVIQASRRDSRIIFKGLLPREDVLKLQKKANILINPRPNNDEYTKFSFPSKILEYMSSGTPVISYKLDGIPNEYYDFMYTVSSGRDGLFNTLREVLTKSEQELTEKGLQAKSFALTKKNGSNQARKIIDMVKNINI